MLQLYRKTKACVYTSMYSKLLLDGSDGTELGCDLPVSYSLKLF